MTTTPTTPSVRLPAGAITTEEWQPAGEDRNYRIFDGEERDIGHGVRVWTHGIQYDDGRIDDGTGYVGERPAISVDGLTWEKGISGELARHLADVLVTAADELDRWSVR